MEKGTRTVPSSPRGIPVPGCCSRRDFQKAFNHFYRVRRGRAWQEVFCRELALQAGGRPALDVVLNRRYGRLGRVEASFASNLVATVDSRQLVIDSVVLEHAGLSLRRTGPAADRIKSATAVHCALGGVMTAFLDSVDGRYLGERFEATYPASGVPEMKMPDLVLWQRRD